MKTRKSNCWESLRSILAARCGPTCSKPNSTGSRSLLTSRRRQWRLLYRSTKASTSRIRRRRTWRTSRRGWCLSQIWSTKRSSKRRRMNQQLRLLTWLYRQSPNTSQCWARHCSSLRMHSWAAWGGQVAPGNHQQGDHKRVLERRSQHEVSMIQASTDWSKRSRRERLDPIKKSLRRRGREHRQELHQDSRQK